MIPVYYKANRKVRVKLLPANTQLQQLFKTVLKAQAHIKENFNGK